MQATILGLGTAVPPHIYPQEAAAEKMIEVLSLEENNSKSIRQLYKNSAIHKRHAVLDDFQHEKGRWTFWGKDFPKTVPGMSARNDIYKREAPKLAYEAARKAIKQWGRDPQFITHIIFISCTGLVAPGIEFHLMQQLNLSPSTNRLGINFMGCFGAFKGFSVAQAFAKENPSNRVLVVCTELCSLHLQADLDPDTIVANSLFSDGASAAIIGTQPLECEKPLWEIARSHSLGVEKSLDKMAWEASDRGFLIKLSHTVPVYLGRTIKTFVEHLTPLSPQDCDWAIHPGGKSIIQAIEKALKLEREQTVSSWKVLAEYGNMSSATFLFVLDELSRQENQKKWAVGLAFGPGLSIEGVLLKQARI